MLNTLFEQHFNKSYVKRRFYNQMNCKVVSDVLTSRRFWSVLNSRCNLIVNSRWSWTMHWDGKRNKNARTATNKWHGIIWMDLDLDRKNSEHESSQLVYCQISEIILFLFRTHSLMFSFPLLFAIKYVDKILFSRKFSYLRFIFCDVFELMLSLVISANSL